MKKSVLKKGLNTFKLILIIATASILTSCDKDDDTPQYSIIGEWVNSSKSHNHTYTFSTNGSFTDVMVYDPVPEGYFASRNVQGTYSIKGDTIFAHVTSDDHPDIEPEDLPYEDIAFFKLGNDHKGEYLMLMNDPDAGNFAKYYRK